jgi:hypothetical protein
VPVGTPVYIHANFTAGTPAAAVSTSVASSDATATSTNTPNWTATAASAVALGVMCTDKMCGVPCEDGYTLDSTSGICTHNFLAPTSASSLSLTTSYKQVTFQRYIQGLPVIGTSLNMTLTGGTSSPDAVISSISATLPATDAITNAVLLTPEQAIAKALVGTSATEATTSLVVYNAGLMATNQCQTSNRIVYQVTLLDPGPYDPSMRIIDPGHGGILLEQAGGVGDQQLESYGKSTTLASFPATMVAKDPVCNTATQSPYCLNSGKYPGAIELYNLAAQSYNFFLSKFNRDGPNGRGNRLRTLYNSVGDPADPGHFTPAIGIDGGQIMLNGLGVLNEPDVQYIVTHEYGHAVMYGSGVYMLNGKNNTKTDAIGEGMADLFAFYHKDAWQLSTTKDVRNAIPVQDWSNSGDPHFSGLRLGHVAYTAGNGGSGTDENGDPVTVTPGPGGDDATAQIFYDTIYTGKITGYPSWSRLSQATVDDASDASNEDDPHTLNGVTIDPHDCGAIMNAWAAVGYGEGDRDNDCVPNLQDDCPDTYDPKQDDTCCPKYLDQLKKNGADIAEATKECNKDPGTPPGIKRNAPASGGGITPGHWESYSGRADSWLYAEGSILGNIVQALGFNFAHLDCLIHNWGIFNGNYPEYSCEYWVF